MFIRSKENSFLHCISLSYFTRTSIWEGSRRKWQVTHWFGSTSCEGKVGMRLSLSASMESPPDGRPEAHPYFPSERRRTTGFDRKNSFSHCGSQKSVWPF